MLSKVLLICICLQHVTYETTGKCVDPTITMEYVDSCPESSTGWRKAAQKKNCSAYEKTCGDNAPVKYHCIMNAYRNSTLEICAAEMSIVGHYCPEYNQYGNLIQEHYGTVCKSCPFYYYSTEVYKYPECVQYQNTTEEDAALLKAENNNHTSSVEDTNMQNVVKSTTALPYISASTTTITTISTTATNASFITPASEKVTIIFIWCILLILTVISSVFIYIHLRRQIRGLCKETMYCSEMKLISGTIEPQD